DVETELARLTTRGNVAEDVAVADVRATILIGAHDPRAPEAALDAARKLMALHKLHAASDVLLDFIGAGFADREAQRLLIEVNCELGRRETAREKCQLLGTAYRLDGQGAVAVRNRKKYPSVNSTRTWFWGKSTRYDASTPLIAPDAPRLGMTESG